MVEVSEDYTKYLVELKREEGGKEWPDVRSEKQTEFRLHRHWRFCQTFGFDSG